MEGRTRFDLEPNLSPTFNNVAARRYSASRMFGQPPGPSIYQNWTALSAIDIIINH